MDLVGLVSVSWRQGGADAIAHLTAPKETHGELLHRLRADAGLCEAVYLATCNRVEVIFAGDGETPIAAYRPRIFEALAGRKPAPGEAEQTFRAWVGEGAAEHLLMVAAGLDSARVGETEIAGQTRAAYDLAREHQSTGPRLEMLFEEAFKISRRVHRNSGVGNGRESLAEIALSHLRRRLERTPGRTALVGVSDMTRRVAAALREQGYPVTVVNRTLARAEELAASVGGEARSLEAFRARPEPVEALLLATGSAIPVLDRSVLERIAALAPSGESPLVIDMGIPADVSPQDAHAAGLPRIGMDEILEEAKQNRAGRLEKLADARLLVDDALIGLRRRMADRLLSPLIAALQTRFRDTAVEGVERLFQKELKGLAESERSAVTRWAETLARRFAHLPVKGLRGIAYDGGSNAVRTFIRHAEDADLLAALERSYGRPDALQTPTPHPEMEV